MDLIRKMSLANPRSGVRRIHGELWKLGFQLSQATVAKYMVRPRRPPSQTWRTFLQNHRKDMVAADFFLVPTVYFEVLPVFVILSHDRRWPVRFAATEHPTAEWVARKLLEAFPWDSSPRHLLSDRDGSYREAFRQAAKMKKAPDSSGAFLILTTISSGYPLRASLALLTVHRRPPRLRPLKLTCKRRMTRC
jgi:hypothetical protein